MDETKKKDANHSKTYLEAESSQELWKKMWNVCIDSRSFILFLPGMNDKCFGNVHPGQIKCCFCSLLYFFLHTPHLLLKQFVSFCLECTSCQIIKVMRGSREGLYCLCTKVSATPLNHINEWMMERKNKENNTWWPNSS